MTRLALKTLVFDSFVLFSACSIIEKLREGVLLSLKLLNFGIHTR